MKVTITFEDKGAQSVVMKSEIEFTSDEESADKPTPSSVLALGTTAMFKNGMLARAGQIALKGISDGKAPEDCVLAAFEEKKNDDTDSG